MNTLKLRDDFYWTGIVDSSLRVFDIIMYTEFGTSYNSYLLKTQGQTVLFETAKLKFWEEYEQKLQEIAQIRRIDYLVVNHTEPDHSGSIEKLLELNPGMKIVGSPCAIGFLKNIVNRDFYAIPVKDNQEMKIGDYTLRFLSVPNLHWPDSIYTYIEEAQILVTCDSFGSHYALPDVLASKVTDKEGYMRATKYYFDCIMGPFKSHVRKALERVRQLDLSLVCPGHGPVLDTPPAIDLILNKYQEWSAEENPNKKLTVVMPYVSAYGYTEQLAGKIAAGIADSGDIDVRRYDMVTADAAQVQAELGYADGILFGTPTIVGEALKPIWDLTTSMFAQTHGGKLASAFGSYGWSGEGVPHILERLRQLRMKTPDDGFRVKFKPGESDLVSAYEYGYNFGCLLQNKENPKKTSGKRQLVKCLVCGEIFDASLEVCPVCGVGKENFVPVEDGDTGYRQDTDSFYVVIGNGTAGFSAASAIRQRDKTGTVVLISDEPYPSYNRPMLTKALLASVDPQYMAIEDAAWYEEQNIYQILGHKVVSIDTKAQEVVLDDGSHYKYTKLVYALGSECFIPPIPGHDKPEVIAIRRIADTAKISALLPSSKHAVVIGGGVLGLEAAWELHKSGCQVTVLELAPQLMGRQLDAQAGEMLMAIAQGNDIDIRVGVQIASIEGDAHVTGVKLADGTLFPANLVIVSAGVRANTALASDTGIAVDRAVVVNERMETNLPGIYACGDCAQFDGMNYAIWPEASEQGTVAGANAAGEALAYKPVAAGLSFKGMNTALYAIGDNGKNPNLVYKTVEFRDPGKKEYEKYYFVNSRLCGVILIGDVSRMAELTKAVEDKETFQKLFS